MARRPRVRRRRELAHMACCLLASALVFGWMGVAVAQAAPANAALPSTTGTPEQGQRLTLERGTWIDATAVTITDQWERCRGTACTAISGASALTYTLTAADVGQAIKVAETAKATDGSTTVGSAATGTVTGNSAPPTISGAAQQGQTLILHQGVWTNSPASVTDQWRDCTGGICTPIAGATTATYTATAGDVGHTIDVVETATNAAGALTATSTPTATVVPGVGPLRIPLRPSPGRSGRAVSSPFSTARGHRPPHRSPTSGTGARSRG